MVAWAGTPTKYGVVCRALRYISSVGPFCLLWFCVLGIGAHIQSRLGVIEVLRYCKWIQKACILCARVGLETCRKCRIWRYLYKGMWYSGNLEVMAWCDRSCSLRKSCCTLSCGLCGSTGGSRKARLGWNSGLSFRGVMGPCVGLKFSSWHAALKCSIVALINGCDLSSLVIIAGLIQGASGIWANAFSS